MQYMEYGRGTVIENANQALMSPLTPSSVIIAEKLHTGSLEDNSRTVACNQENPNLVEVPLAYFQNRYGDSFVWKNDSLLQSSISQVKGFAMWQMYFNLVGVEDVSTYYDEDADQVFVSAESSTYFTKAQSLAAIAGIHLVQSMALEHIIEEPNVSAETYYLDTDDHPHNIIFVAPNHPEELIAGLELAPHSPLSTVRNMTPDFLLEKTKRFFIQRAREYPAQSLAFNLALSRLDNRKGIITIDENSNDPGYLLEPFLG